MTKNAWNKSSPSALATATVLFLLAGTARSPAAHADSSAMVPLPTGVSPIAQLGEDLGRLPADTPMEVVAILHLRRERALTRLIALQNTPTSMLYHRFLTPEQFAAKFSPTPAAYSAVVSYFQGLGF